MVSVMGLLRGTGAVLLVVLCASGAPAAAQTQPASCDVAAQNLYVRDVMTDIYFWYREIPDVDPVVFASPAEYPRGDPLPAAR